MKFIIETALLRDALKTVLVAAASRPVLPILSHVLIEAKDGVRFTATDLDLRCEHIVAADVLHEGSTVAPLALLARLMERLQSSKADLELTGMQLVVRGGDVTATLETLPAEEFPPETPQSLEGVEMEVSELLAPFRKLAYAMGSDTGRYNLMGINVAPEKTGSEFAASNGTKVAIQAHERKLTEDAAIIPDVFVRAFLKLQLSGIGRVIIGNGTVAVANQSTKVSAKLIEGHYPNYKQVIPKNGSQIFSCRRSDLMNAIATCALFTEKELPGLRLIGRGKELEVTKPFSASVRVLGSELQGQPDFEIGFNSRHMLETLSVMEGEEVRIRCSDPTSAMRIDEGKFTAVLVPVVLNTIPL